MDDNTLPIQFAGEERGLKFGFKAWTELSLNPFKPATIQEYIAGIDITKAAAWIRAGLLHEYAKGGTREGQTAPTVDEVQDVIAGSFPKVADAVAWFCEIVNRQLDDENARGF